MKLISIILTIIATLSIGFFFIVYFPEKAKVGEYANHTFLEDEKSSMSKTESDLILRDKCNTAMLEKKFDNSQKADEFLNSCLSGNEVSSINVIGQEISNKGNTDSKVELSKEDRLVKCNTFMEHATFDSEKAKNDFYNTCVNGN